MPPPEDVIEQMNCFQSGLEMILNRALRYPQGNADNAGVDLPYDVLVALAAV
jgi:hypothetical protein